jgi:hypothetical protein
MKIFLRLVLIAVVVGAGVWLWIVLFPGPEKIIRQRLAEIARLASFTRMKIRSSRWAARKSWPGFAVLTCT